MDDLNAGMAEMGITNDEINGGMDACVDDVVVKRKKGRPRKEPVISEGEKEKPQEEKKKRGRKKKEVVVEEAKPKKKRGRKAAVKYFSSSIRKKIPLTTVLQDNNNYILHLNVDQSDVVHMDIEASNDVEGDQEIKNQSIDQMFQKLQEENNMNLSVLQKEYDDLLENEGSIISEVMDNEDDLTELYERRIEKREHQDSQLFDKLQQLHKNPDIVEKIFLQPEMVDVDKDAHDNQEQNRKKGYFELLRSFIKNDTWLHHTDVCCWWCCHTFDSVPIGLPEKYDSRIKKFQVKGVFCSFSCMLAYKNQVYRSRDTDYLIKFLYSKLTGTFLLDAVLKSAPPRCSLKMFGGELTIEEFRHSLQENKIYKMIEYPMFVSKDYIEEVDIQNVKRVNQNVFTEQVVNKSSNLDERRIEDAKIRLSQIEKTTITVGNTIDRFIKIT